MAAHAQDDNRDMLKNKHLTSLYDVSGAVIKWSAILLFCLLPFIIIDAIIFDERFRGALGYPVALLLYGIGFGVALAFLTSAYDRIRRARSS